MGRQCQVSKTFFEPGDRLLLFTDGLTETHNVEGDMFGIDGVTAILRGLDDVADSEAVLAALTAARRRFARDEVPEDDVLLLAARFL
jgi:serine phosphatase RsbU (regulator of sigma subunit)